MEIFLLLQVSELCLTLDLIGSSFCEGSKEINKWVEQTNKISDREQALDLWRSAGKNKGDHCEEASCFLKHTFTRRHRGSIK